MNSIFIQDLKVKTKLGVPDWERLLPQSVLIDIEIALPNHANFNSDNIQDTIDYGEVCAMVERLLGEQTFKLVDQLSGRTLGLRADMTPQVARIDAHLLNRQGVTRLCYAGSVAHARTPVGSSAREELQIGAEIYGCAGWEADFEAVTFLLSCPRWRYSERTAKARDGNPGIPAQSRLWGSELLPGFCPKVRRGRWVSRRIQRLG